jgi:acyl-CoA thioester hydrolase
MKFRDPKTARTLLPGFPVIIVQPVAWGDLDLHGHVNNVWIFRYLENARIAYYEAIDKFEHEEKTGEGLVLASSACRFKKPLTYPDSLLIGAGVKGILTDRMIMAYRIASRRRQCLAVEAEATLVSYNFRKNLKIPFPAELAERVRRLEAAEESLTETWRAGGETKP